MKVFYIKQLTRRGRRKFVLSAESFYHVVCRILERYSDTVVLQVEDITASTSPSEFTTESDVHSPSRFNQTLTIFIGLLIAVFFAYHSSIDSVPVWGRVVLVCMAFYGALMAGFNVWRLFKGLRFEQWVSEVHLPDQVTLVEGQTTTSIERLSETKYDVFVRGTVWLGAIIRLDHEHVIRLDHEHAWTVKWVTGEPVCHRSFDRALLDVCHRLCGHLADS